MCKNKQHDFNQLLRLDKRQRGGLTVNAGASLLLVAALAGLALWGLMTMAESNVMPIKRVQVEGLFKHANSEHLQNKISGQTSGGFFNVDVTEIENAVKEIAWIRSASVRRVWPDTLRILVEEQKAVAVWNKKGLLNVQGEVFYPGAESVPAGLPELVGPEGSHDILLGQYKQMVSKLEKLDQGIQSLEMDDRYAWRLVLDSGVNLVMGRTDVDAALDRFIAVFDSSLSKKIEEIVHVDLRYTNGFSVRWKSNTVSTIQNNSGSWRGNI